MNWHRVSKILFSLAVVYLLLLQPEPSIAHSGHQHEQKSVGEPGQPPSEIIPVAPEQPQIPSSTSVQVAPASEVNPSNSTPISWLPQPGELLFLLLVTGPFGLFYLKGMLSEGERSHLKGKDLH